ncbi:MAG: pyruvate dehydrogenase (acetyl-transferring) E1 component subunit alpha [Pseudomonadota bacterium]
MSTVAKFEIEHHQFINKDGKPTQDSLPEFATNENIMKQFYRDMLLLRAFDAKAYALQRTGNMGTYPASLGQEAIGVGYGAALNKEDVLVPYYRSTGGLLQHGVSMTEILQYWGGYEEGSNYKVAREDFPIAVPIATQCLHATGIATAFKLRNQARACITEIGEGGTSKGDFYEAINVAGIWNLGVVFIVNNNQWAISVPSSIQTATETYAQKAVAAGIEGVQVDGNDIVAVHHYAKKALEKARAGGGATLIECISYRLCDHTTADDAKRYRSDNELEQAWESEPVLRLKKYIDQQFGQLDDEQEATMKKEINQHIETAVTEYNQTPQPNVTEIFDHMYETLPQALLEQREQAIKRG